MRANVLITILFALFICAQPLLAQNGGPGRHGIVVDESGGAVPGARVSVHSMHGTTLNVGATGPDGAFTVDGLPPGSYWLEVAARHFQPQHTSLVLDGSDRAAAPPLRIVLSLAPLQSDVTVTAQRGMVDEIDRTPPVVTVRQAEDVRTRPLATTGNMLEGAPGVMVQQSTYGQASPFLRGLTGYQVLNLIDGIRFNNSTFRSGPNQYLAFVDPSQLQRVEVMLGPASSQFGSDAMGGAIQVLTPTAGFNAAPGSAFSGRANLFGAGADESVVADASFLIQGRNVSGFVGGGHRNLSDLRAGGATDSHHVLRRLFGLDDDEIRGVTGERQVDTGFDQSSVQAKLAAKLGGQQSLTVWYQRSAQDGVFGYKDLWGGLGRLQSEFDPQRLQFLYSRYERLGVGRLDWVSGTFSVNSQDDGSVRQNLRPTDVITRDDVGVDAFGYALQAGMQAGSRHGVVFGGEIYDEHIDALREETDPRTGATDQKRPLYPNGSRYRTSGVFVNDVVDLVHGLDGPRLAAHLGGRFTRVDVRTYADRNLSASGQSFGVVDSERTYHDWTFNAGLTWEVTRVLGLNVLVGRGFRAPNLNDLGALGLNDLGYEVPAESAIEAGGLIGASDGEGVISSGRPVTDLKSERLFNFEVGTTVNWDRLHARAHVFDAELHDPIVRRSLVFPSGSVPSSLSGVPVAPIAATAAQREQGVVSVATPIDARSVKAFVNEGRARYYGVDSLIRYRLSTRWSAEANYSFLVGRDLDPSRPIRRLPPQQGVVALRYQPRGLLSWIEASAWFSGPQELFSGGDVTDERIGAARRRSDITAFFQGGLISPFISAGHDGVMGSTDDVFLPTGETAAQIRDRVLPIGATINGVTVVDDSTRVPLYTRTPGFVTVNLRTGLTLNNYFDLTFALMNAFDQNYRVHGSGVDAPGRSVFAGASVSF